MSNRIMFLRDRSNQPVGCIASSVNRKSWTISYQLSVLNPHDHFDRKMARRLAIGGLSEAPITIPIPYFGADELSSHIITRAIMEDLATRKSLPSRAVKSAKLWLQDQWITAAL